MSSGKNILDPAGANRNWCEAIVENAPALICRYLHDTTLTYVNRTMCGFFNMSKKEMTGRKLSDWIQDEDKSLLDLMTGALIADRKSSRMELRVILPDGSVRHTEWTCSPAETNTDDTEIQGFGVDITEKKKSEEILHLERELFISGPVITVKWNAAPGAPIEYISPNVFGILGYPSEDFITGRLDLRSLIHPDDVERCRSEAQKYARNNAETFQQEYRLVNKKGESRWFTDFVRVVKDASNNIKHYRGYIYDISVRKSIEEALRQSEERFRYVSSSISNISYSCKAVSGDDLNIDWIYGASEKITGYSAEELIRMKCWGNIVLKEDFPLFRKHIHGISPGLSDSCQLRIRHKNGNTIWVEATAECIITDISAQTRYVYGAIVNINERKLAEEAMKRSEQELRKTNKMKDKFFSIISHDLRSPFQGLIGMANILVEDEDLTAEERKEFTLKLYESLKTQFHFIDDLLTWNRIQRGAIEFIPAIDDMTAVLRQTLELLANSIENKKLRVVLDTPDDVTLNFDRNMVATIIRNLITNAVKFTPHGGTIKIRIDNRPDTVEVSVQDTGIGIDNSDLKKLWDSEFHRSTKGTDGEDGTGLGLILCKEFVEKHGGLISAESEINIGSTFRFSIPKNLQGDL